MNFAPLPISISPERPDTPATTRENRLIRAIEARHLPACAHVTAASPGIADAYVEAYGIARPRVVRNAFPRGQAPPASTARGSAQPGPSVYWFSQVIGPDRGLECAVEAIGRAHTRPHLYLRGHIATGFLPRLHAIAARCGAAGHLHILAPDEPDRMERLAAGYDVGLACEPAHTRNSDILLSNKLFTYLLAGLPAIMSATSAQRAFAAETGTSAQLYPIGDAVALAALIDGLLADPARLAAARAHAWRLGQETYNWETESRALVDTVGRSLAITPRGLAANIVGAA